VSGAEIITRRRKWGPAQKAALLEEVEAEGGQVATVGRRHGISESLLYSWRWAWKAAASAASAPQPVDFVPLGIVGEASRGEAAAAGAVGGGAFTTASNQRRRIWHDRDCGAERRAHLRSGLVSEKVLSRVLRAMRRCGYAVISLAAGTKKWATVSGGMREGFVMGGRSAQSR
jgi:transposase-like protein